MHTSFTPTDTLVVFPFSVSSRTIWVYSDATAVCMLIFATYQQMDMASAILFITRNQELQVRIRQKWAVTLLVMSCTFNMYLVSDLASHARSWDKIQMNFVLKVSRVILLGKLAYINFLGRVNPSLELNLLKILKHSLNLIQLKSSHFESTTFWWGAKGINNRTPNYTYLFHKLFIFWKPCLSCK